MRNKKVGESVNFSGTYFAILYFPFLIPYFAVPYSLFFINFALVQ